MPQSRTVALVYPAYENLGIEYLSAVLTECGHRTFLLYDPVLFNEPLQY